MCIQFNIKFNLKALRLPVNLTLLIVILLLAGTTSAVSSPKLIGPTSSVDSLLLPGSERKQEINAFWQDRAVVLSTLAIKHAPLKLWYTKPASAWEEALPLGNGKIGAMVFGGVADERIQLNESTLWGGSIIDSSNPKGKMHLPLIQQLLFDGKNKEALTIADSTLMGNPRRIMPYQALGELWFDMPHLNVTNYQRALDLETATVSTVYDHQGVRYFRESFISAPHKVMVIRYHASGRKALDLNFTWKRAQDYTVASDSTDRTAIILEGQVGAEFQYSGEKGLHFAGMAKVLLKGGKLTNHNGRIEIRQADEICIIISCATNYPGLKEVGMGKTSSATDPLDVCKENIASAAAIPYERLKKKHIQDYQSYFNRTKLMLESTENTLSNNVPTDSLIRMTKASKVIPASLITKYFQYGRYLLISSSRPGGMPANLQGIWCWQMKPVWNSDFHTNINLQMNYWPAESTNLPELHLPLFDLTEALIPSGTKTAQATYGAQGWVLHHLTDAWGYTAPADGVWGIWPMGGAWLAQHPWDHFSYTQDKDFLKNRAYPILKGAAEFVVDFMIKIPTGKPFEGYWTTNPSHSPENSFMLPNGEVSSFTYGATMDTQIIRDLLQHYIQAAEILEVDQVFANQCRAVLTKLIPTQVSAKTGRVMEWIDDYKETEVQHRHVSHLFGLFPGSEISILKTPELAAAAKKTLISRGDGATGWSLAWKINMWNRLHDGNHSYLLFRNLISDKTLPNMFDNHPPFQIDGNFGATAALAEMFLQSHVKDEHGNYILELLPAVGDNMPNGVIEGLKARGNIEVDIAWEKGKLVWARIRPLFSGNIPISYLGKTIQVVAKARQPISLDPKAFL
ncbi:MAG: hypothetical protein K0R59_243 [Sphingobacterium sp.]|jgi:alpha-L-fucosidase 2|nr:hypothetical protein [Sphingobacterium sp.]